MHQVGFTLDFMYLPKSGKFHHHVGIGTDGSVSFLNGFLIGGGDFYHFVSYNPFSKGFYTSVGAEWEIAPGTLICLESGTDFQSPATLNLVMVYNLDFNSFINFKNIFNKKWFSSS